MLILITGSVQTRQVIQAFRSVKNNDGTNQAWLGMMLFLASLVILTALMVIAQRRWRGWLKSSPRGLFLELCTAHRLKGRQRRLLWRLAQSQKLADPASLFLTPECFEIGRLTVEMRPHAAELRKVQKQLFAESSEEPKAAQRVVAKKFREEEKPTAALSLSPLPPTIELPTWTTNPGMGTLD